MGKPFANKRGLKRPKSTGQAEYAEKRRKIIQNPSPTSAGDFSSEEEEISSGHFTFDNLLKRLASSNEKKAKGRRRIEETRGDSGEDEDGDSESAETYEVENGGLEEDQPAYIPGAEDIDEVDPTTEDLTYAETQE